MSNLNHDLGEFPSVVLDRHRLIGTEGTPRGFRLEELRNIDSDAVVAPVVGSFRQTPEPIRPRSEWPAEEHHSWTVPVVGHLDVYQEIQQAVIQKSTKEEIDRVFCERLVQSGKYTVASICTVTLSTGNVRPRAVAGGSEEPVTGNSPTDDAEVGVLEDATLAAASSGKTHIVHVGSDSKQLEVLPGFTRGDEHCWIIAIPVTFEGTQHGVFTACAARKDGFEAKERTVLEGLALTVGHALNAARWKQAFVGKTCVELDVWLPNLFDSPGLPVDQRDGDTAVTVDGMVPVGARRVIQYLTVTGRSQESFREAMAKIDETESVRQLDGGRDGTRFEVIYDDFPLVSTLVSYGGRIKTAHFDVPDLHATVVLPLAVDVRQLVEELQSNVPDLKLGAQRTVHRGQPTTAPYEDGFEGLTAHQRTAVQTAFLAGYFEWPRESTAEEVATNLEISSPTFHYHLRLAQKKILSGILERHRLVEG